MTQLLTIKAAAKASGIGYPTMKALARDRKLPTVLLPGRRRPMIDMADLDALIQASKVGTVPGSSEENPSSPNNVFTALPQKSHRDTFPNAARPQRDWKGEVKRRLNA